MGLLSCPDNGYYYLRTFFLNSAVRLETDNRNERYIKMSTY